MILALVVGHPEYGQEHRPWTNGDLALWAEALQAKGILRHGVKAKLKATDLEKPATMERLDEIFEPAALESLMAAWDGSYRDLLEWWRTRVTPDLSERVKYPAEIAAMRGPQAVHETPQVIIGTIHSVKGGQADCGLFVPRPQPGGRRAVRAWRRSSRFSDPAILRGINAGAGKALHLRARRRMAISI